MYGGLSSVKKSEVGKVVNPFGCGRKSMYRAYRMGWQEKVGAFKTTDLAKFYLVMHSAKGRKPLVEIRYRWGSEASSNATHPIPVEIMQMLAKGTVFNKSLVVVDGVAFISGMPMWWNVLHNPYKKIKVNIDAAYHSNANDFMSAHAETLVVALKYREKFSNYDELSDIVCLLDNVKEFEQEVEGGYIKRKIDALNERLADTSNYMNLNDEEIRQHISEVKIAMDRLAKHGIKCSKKGL